MSSYRPFTFESLHDQIVRQVYNFFASDPTWHLPRADLRDAIRPLTYGGRIPDVTAYRGPNASRCLLEVETAESYKTKHALAQYRAFVNFGRLVVCVPSRVEIDARIFLAMQGIDAIVIGYAEPATRPPLLGMVTAPTRIR